MSSVFVGSLKYPTDAQVKEMVDVSVEAFGDGAVFGPLDPTIMIMTGGDSNLNPDLFQLSIRAAALDGNLIVCQQRLCGKILSLACTYGPGKMFMASTKQRDLGIDDYIEKLPSEGKEWWEKYMKQADNFPQEIMDSWFTVIMATDTSAQGKGYGSLIMKEVLKMAAKDRVTAMLSAAETNVAFYKSLGFIVKDSAVVKTPYGTFTSYTLVWEPSI